MKKPDSFYDLPECIQEHLLWNMNLKYDPYDYSRAEAIHNILNNKPHPNSDNDRIIRHYYLNLKADMLESMVRQHMESALDVYESLKKMLDENENPLDSRPEKS